MEFNVLEDKFANKLSKDNRVSIKVLYDKPLIVYSCRIDKIKDKQGILNDKFIFEFKYYPDLNIDDNMHFAISDSSSVRDRLFLAEEQFPALLYITHVHTRDNDREYATIMSPKSYYKKLSDELKDRNKEFYYEDNKILADILIKYYKYDPKTVKHRNQVEGAQFCCFSNK